MKLLMLSCLIQEKKYQDLVLEGETEKAALLREEIRNAEKEQLMSEMQSKMGQTVQQDRETRELQQKAEEIVEVLPIFNHQLKLHLSLFPEELGVLVKYVLSDSSKRIDCSI